MTARYLAAAAALLLSACSPTGPTPRLDEEFVLAPGDVAVVESVALKIRFVGVTSDSRCPADVVCIQAGDAVVHIEARSSGRTESHELHTADMRPVEHNGLAIALVELQPYPFSSRTIDSDDYRATLKVTE